ncbi:ATP-dependent RNA helicase dbp6 [Lecanicillium sp. MT-2017a]|nr:ATP-dependent RNA helicase dbp6 [Lecanicillium sp. MT-2017a]
MYARFVPSANGQAAKPAATTSSNSRSQKDDAGPAKSWSDDPKTKKSKRKRDEPEETHDAPSRETKKSKAADSKDVNGSKSKKSSKEKKDKKKRVDTEEPEALTKSTDADGDEKMDDPEGAAEPSAKQAKREKKKKKAKAAAVQEEAEPEEDSKHKSLLERKEKSLKLAVEAAKKMEGMEEAVEEEQHGLEPLPQPIQPEAEEVKPTYDTLPSWLSAPIRVAQSARTNFTDIGITPKAVTSLQEKGYSEAFAVQIAAIPLLRPTAAKQPGDLLISAATGSGKTLAYALPIVEDISQGVITRLRAVVVLPTRELVRQAQEVFEMCAKAYDGGDSKRVRIGVSIGSQSLKTEQEMLIARETRYNPEEYSMIQEAARKASGRSAADAELDMDLDPRLGPWDGEVVDFYSTVDVLICTPGRLVEHMEQTPGFDLDYVRWLVVDEADKLLAQSYQGWLDLVMQKFQTTKFGARDFPSMAYSGVRKVILSATLTRDLSLLNQLGLRRPQLIVLETDADAQVSEHTLPEQLAEFAIRVHDANLKPLYLLDLLSGGQMESELRKIKDAARGNSDAPMQDATNTDTSSDSDSSSDASTDTSTTDSSSDSSSDSDSDSDTSSDSSSDDEAPPVRPTTIPTALIFTKSNESALRLSRLLAILDKTLTNRISTLTSTTPTSARRKILRGLTAPQAEPRLIIASDLVARGIDIPRLAHVVNYDLPPSVASYVHRVGRTARAGRAGCAWTLVGDAESGWFWGKIAKGSAVRRRQKVARTRIEEMGDDKVAHYEYALEKLGKEAQRGSK